MNAYRYYKDRFPLSSPKPDPSRLTLPQQVRCHIRSAIEGLITMEEAWALIACDLREAENGRRLQRRRRAIRRAWAEAFEGRGV